MGATGWSPMSWGKSMSKSTGLPTDVLLPGGNIINKTDPSFVATGEIDRKQQKRDEVKLDDARKKKAANRADWDRYYNSQTSRGGRKSLLY